MAKAMWPDAKPTIAMTTSLMKLRCTSGAHDGGVHDAAVDQQARVVDVELQPAAEGVDEGVRDFPRKVVAQRHHRHAVRAVLDGAHNHAGVVGRPPQPHEELAEVRDPLDLQVLGGSARDVVPVHVGDKDATGGSGEERDIFLSPRVTALRIFVTAQTINSANYAYFLAQQEILKLENLHAFEIYTEELLNLHRGQGLDIYWRDTSLCPTEDEYFIMVCNKTGGLFRLAVRLMQLCGSSDRDYVPFVNVLGIIFQVQDDYLNLQSEQYAKNKGFGEDLSEGKFSFPIIHSIRGERSGSIQLRSILQQRTEDEAVKLLAVSLIEQSGSFEHTRRTVERLALEARQALEAVDRGDLGLRRKHELVVDQILNMVGLEGSKLFSDPSPSARSSSSRALSNGNSA
ncbi:uncharacterized protein PpBr36_10628 [Pyricularia pennisetigena]|uniref:uncharacterized protein n=1 Tax=Pyricularia pennisetigena TaxID=1578925 RepID=UPI0011504C6F|nr:uncharacterized protein PpBr36_10628 [Pyricularia pennisetigena]TLS21082.1 hypothetical protein PpBr36_10628 [Pyricularia pennisetigena]